MSAWSGIRSMAMAGHPTTGVRQERGPGRGEARGFIAAVSFALRRQAAFAVVLAVLGFGLVTAASSARAQKRRDQPRQSRLVQLILDRRHQLSDLDAAVRKLRDQVAAAQADASKVDAATRDR